MMKIMNVSLFVEMGKKQIKKIVMMLMKFLMMDVLNVNINVLLIVLIVNKVSVMNVKQDMN